MQSEYKWNDSFSSWIVFELLLVVPVLALGPDDHLVGPSQGEQTHRETAGHD